nr:hypothetical protein [Thalassospira profundimaris]
MSSNEPRHLSQKIFDLGVVTVIPPAQMLDKSPRSFRSRCQQWNTKRNKHHAKKWWRQWQEQKPNQQTERPHQHQSCRFQMLEPVQSHSIMQFHGLWVRIIRVIAGAAKRMFKDI